VLGKKSQLERKLRDLLMAKSPINQPGRLLAHLLNELTLIPDRNGKSEAEIVYLLEAMAESGEITTDRRGKLWDGVTYVGLVDPTPVPECAEVSVIHDSTPTNEEDSTTREEFKMSETEPQKSGSRIDNLNAALRELRKVANPETGEIRRDSAAIIIAMGLGVSKAVANSLNGTLGKLQLRLTEGSKASLVHLIDMSDTVVTEEMLRGVESKDETPEVAEQVELQPEPVAELVEPAVEPTSDDRSPEEILVDIIEDLDEKLTAALAEVSRVTTENGQLKKLLAIQEQAVVKSAETIEQLTRQLNTRKLSDRVANTLKKYKGE
jgi:hypothetical protein